MLTGMAIDPIVVAGSPTALGGHFAGMERGPAELRAPAFSTASPPPDMAGGTLLDHGDARNDPGWAADADPRMKNQEPCSTTCRGWRGT